MQLARIVREVLLASPMPPERYEGIDRLISDVLDGGGAESWRAVARAIWSDSTLFFECDAVPSLRSRIREASVGTVMDAITSLIGRAIIQRADEISWYISIHDGRLWIPDAAFPPLQYLLEMNDWGYNPTWVDDRDMADHVGDPIGPGGVWKLWMERSTDGDLARGYLSTQVFLGSLPAWGLPERAEPVRPLAKLVRKHPSPVAVLQLPEPALLGLAPEGRLPPLDALLASTRSPAERDAMLFSFTPRDYQVTRRLEPLAALRSYLARTGERSLARGVVAIIEMTAIALAPLGSQGKQGVWRIPMEVDRPMPEAWALRSGATLYLDVEGVAGLACLLGLFPFAYRSEVTMPAAWDWETLMRCGWGTLTAAGRWQVVELPSRVGSWIKFPPSKRVAESVIPDVGTLADQAIAVTSVARCSMDVDAPWTAPV